MKKPVPAESSGALEKARQALGALGAALMWALMCLALSPAISRAADAGKPRTMEIHTPSSRVTFINLLCSHIDLDAADYGIKLKNLESDNNPVTQLELLSTSLRRKAADSYVVRPTDGQDVRKLIDLIKPHGMPLIFIAYMPPEEIINRYENAWFAGASNVDTAKLLAKAVTDYISAHPDVDQNLNGQVDILLIRGPVDHQDDTARYRELKAALEAAHIKSRFVHEVRGEWYYERAFLYVNKLVEKGQFPDCDLVVAFNDDMALACIDALEQSEKYDSLPDVPIFSVDGTPEALLAVRRGALEATIRQNLERIAKAVLLIGSGQADMTDKSRLQALSDHRIEDRRVLIDPVIITHKNVAPYLKQDIPVPAR